MSQTQSIITFLNETEATTISDERNISEYNNSANLYQNYLHNISDEEYLNEVMEYILPQEFEWIFVALNFIVFAAGLIGNFLVILAVFRNIAMRTVTNIFIVNQAVADFCVLFFCLPATVLWDVTETWFLGTLACKLILYLQVSFHVNILILMLR